MKLVDWRHAEITDQALEEMRSRIGVERPILPWNSIVCADAIKHFANAVGDDNPLWWDEEYAGKTRFGRRMAPPMFLHSCNSFNDPDLKDRMGLPGILALWAGDRWQWHRRVWEGDRISGASKFVEASEHKSLYGGRSIRQVIQSDFYNQKGEHLATYQQVLLRFSRAASREVQKYVEEKPPSYTPQQIEAMAWAYEREVENRRGPRPRYWEDTAVGEPVTELLKGPLTVTSLVTWLLGWGSPYCFTSRILFRYLKGHPQDAVVGPDNIPDTIEAPHWDTYFAQQGGMPRGYDFGSMRCAWFAHQLSDWYGDDGLPRKLEVKFIKPNLVGDTTWLTGKVVAKSTQGEAGLVECELQGRNQRAEVTAVGHAEVELPRRGGKRTAGA